jgi:hypothetical protein
MYKKKEDSREKQYGRDAKKKSTGLAAVMSYSARCPIRLQNRPTVIPRKELIGTRFYRFGCFRESALITLFR